MTSLEFLDVSGVSVSVDGEELLYLEHLGDEEPPAEEFSGETFQVCVCVCVGACVGGVCVCVCV